LAKDEIKTYQINLLEVQGKHEYNQY